MTSNQLRSEARQVEFGRRSRAVFASFAVAGFLAAFASPAAADAEHGQLKIVSQPGAIVLRWTGKVAAPMAQQIETAFEQHKHEANRVVLALASGGGSVPEGERVIQVLRRIKQTHTLQTVVGHGSMCGSMCVFIYVQGEKRAAALSSTWLFHEVSKSDPRTKRIVSLDRAKWEQLVEKYWVPAGVSSEWIERIKPYTVRSDYWQTGADLVNDNSGIVHQALGNQKPRVVADGKGPAPAPTAEIGEPQPWPKRPAPAAEAAPPPERSARPQTNPEVAGKECRIYVGSLGMVVSVPCSTASLAK